MVYCSQVRIPKEEGTFTWVKGGKYIMPPEERWVEEVPYVLLVIVGLKEDGSNGEEVFTPTEDVTFKVYKEVLRGRSVMVDDEFYEEWYTQFQLVDEDEEDDDVEVVEFWTAERVTL